jgi:hypothetical protein
MASPHQDLTAVLQILFAALSAYGCPQAVISDNGSVFTANDYLGILRNLEIEPVHIEKGKPWQNLIESQFKIQLRLADFKVEQAQTLEAIQNHHAAFIKTFNTTRHWAHQNRKDGYRRPADVLGWVKGRVVDMASLRQLFGRVELLRTVNPMASSVCSASTSMPKTACRANECRSGSMRGNCALRMARRY